MGDPGDTIPVGKRGQAKNKAKISSQAAKKQTGWTKQIRMVRQNAQPPQQGGCSDPKPTRSYGVDHKEIP